ncbi:hypothetical protein ACFXJ8_28360 [Nonomuraea sp. NPDC059194]|uniref:hypothetical protein n=1 Tax=Nonomuraea sp. NPDC059194 TaxID=3346764 RepID=UPI0036A0D3B4
MIAAAPRLTPGGRAWLWVLIAALAWTMQVGGCTTGHAGALTAEREVVTQDRATTVEEVSRRSEQPLRRPARRVTKGDRTPTNTTAVPHPCVRTAELRTLLCVWRT